MPSHHGDPDDELADQIECLLDGELGEEEALRLEARLRTDAEARKTLIDVLTVRGLLDLALGAVDSEPSPDCLSVRELMPAYLAGRSSTRHKSVLSSHLADCLDCSAWYRRLDAARLRHPARGRNRAAALALVAVVLGLATVTLRTASGPADGGAPARRAVAGPSQESWPVLPAREDVVGLVGLLDRENADTDGVGVLVEHVRKASPELVRRLPRMQPVSSHLERMGAFGLSSPLQIEELAILVTLLHDGRLAADQRRLAIHPIVTRVKEAARPWLWDRVPEASTAAFLGSVLQGLATIGVREKEGPRLRGIYDEIVERGWVSCLDDILRALFQAKHPDVPDLCLDLLGDSKGLFSVPERRRHLPAMHAYLLASMSGRPDIVQRVERIALGGSFTLGRFRCLALLHKMTGAARWKDGIAALATHADAFIRRRAAVHLGLFGTEAERPVLEKLARDPDPRVGRAADHALKQLGGRLTGSTSRR